jgi:hypothetical protein
MASGLPAVAWHLNAGAEFRAQHRGGVHTRRVLALLVAVCLSLPACSKRTPAPAPPAVATPARQPTIPASAAPRGADHGFIPLDDIAAQTPPDEPTTRRLDVFVSAEGTPLVNASVMLELTGPARGRMHRYAETDEDGLAPFIIERGQRRVIISAYAGDYAAVTIITNIGRRASDPCRIPIVLSEPGVTITAGIISSEPFAPSSMLARIVSAEEKHLPDLRAAVATNCNDRQIVFPPIHRGLSGLCVLLQADDLPRCRSEIFDTRDGLDKTVVLDIPQPVVLRISAITTAQTTLTSLFFFARPLSDAENAAILQPVRTTLSADQQGMFECRALAPALFEMVIAAPDCQPVVTNLHVCEGLNALDVVLCMQRKLTLRGVTVMRGSEAPVSNVNVSVRVRESGAAAAVTSDGDGRFTCVMGLNETDTTLDVVAARDGLSTTYLTVPVNEAHGEIVVVMCPTARIWGYIRARDGTPVAGVHVAAAVNTQLKTLLHNRTNATGVSQPDALIGISTTYGGRTQAPSDADGRYVIDNLAEPETYKLHVISPYCFVPNNADARVNAVDVKDPDDVRHDITVIRKSPIFVKAVDEEQNAVQVYDLHLETSGPRGQGARLFSVNHKGREWYAVNVDDSLCYAGVKVVLFATTPTAASEKSAPLDVCGRTTNHIVLTLTPGTPVVAGHVLLPDGSQAIGVQIQARSSKGGDATRTGSDHLGYFEVHGVNIVEPDSIHLRASSWRANVAAITNVPSGTLALEWRLSTACSVQGRVCHESYGTPATNFTISLAGGGAGKAFRADDGLFTYPVNIWNLHESLSIQVAANGYGTQLVPVTFDNDGACDVGTIILRQEAAQVRGRVVTQDGQPVSANVFVAVTITAGRVQRRSVRTNPADGTYVFQDMPLGPASVEARTALMTARSDTFELRQGQTLEVPDLVINVTNAAHVRLLFVLPDGRPAAGMYVERFQALTDARGALQLWLPPGRLNNVRVIANVTQRKDAVGGVPTQGTELYFSGVIVIALTTTDVTVPLYPTATINGAVFIDERPFSGALLFQPVPRGPAVSTIARDGAFSIKLQGGRYICISRAWHTAAMTQLRSNRDNEIHLRGGRGVLLVRYPWPGTWNCSVALNVNGMFATVAGSGLQANVAETEFTEMPAGEYQLAARCSDAARPTNIATRVYLQNGSREHITLR